MSPVGSMAITRLELKVDRHVNHLHRHVGVVEGGVEEDRDGHGQEHGDGRGHQRGQHIAGTVDEKGRVKILVKK